MTKGVHAMHGLSERKAIELGPRILTINGKTRACYYLTKEELKVLFAKNGFNPNGVSWLKQIICFKEIWGEVGPSVQTILDPEQDEWQIIFINLDATSLLNLQLFGENNDTPILAVVE